MGIINESPRPRIVDMTHLHHAFAFALFIEAFFLMWLITRRLPIQPIAGHTPEIDGLRGLLAFGVFVHHASIWYVFLQTGAWLAPESRLYTHLGQATVSLFFMITGFLFFGKLLKHVASPIDWLHLYVSPCLRILPLYFLVMLIGAVLLALILYTDWVSPMAAPWNKKSLTGLYTAGVTWTLSYEWKFYYALPLLGLFFGHIPLRWLLLSAGMLMLSGANKTLDIHALTFLGGGIAVALSRSLRWQQFARSRWGSAAALLLLIGVVTAFDSAYALWPLACLTLVFSLIANGAGCWGFLTTVLARAFGEITYSIYLLHGPLLFVFFKFGIGLNNAAQLPPATYWLTVATLVPVLLLVSVFSFRWIEQPCMRNVPIWTKWLRNRGMYLQGLLR